MPEKVSSENLVANDVSAAKPTLTVTADLPDGFIADYSIDGTEVDPANSSTLSFDVSKFAVGKHTLKATDLSGKYAPVSTSFVISTDANVASYDAAKGALVKAADATDDQLQNYLSNIASVSVDGASYSAQGRGSVKVIDTTTGAINTGATSGQGDAATKVFDKYGAYQIEVTATGYANNLTFAFNYEADKTALKSAIESVEKLQEDAYSQASWANLQETVTNGKEVLDTVEATDESVEAAVKAINDAKAALEANPRIELSDLIDNAEQLTQADYTKASWKTFDSALQSAKAVAADSSATDAQVTDAKNALVKAQANLAKAATTDQKTDLKVEIGKADVLNESDYTAESWAAYQQALKAAIEVVNGEDLSADEVSQALNQLQKARTALVAASDDSDSNGGTTNNVTNNVTNNTTTTNNGSDSAKSSSAKTGDISVAVAGGFGAIAAAAAAVAAWTRRRFLRK